MPGKRTNKPPLKNKLDEDDKAKILELYEDGFTKAAIARYFKVAKTVIGYHLQAMGAKTRAMSDYFKEVKK